MLVQVVSHDERSVKSVVTEKFKLLGIIVARESLLRALHVEDVQICNINKEGGNLHKSALEGS